VSLGSEFASRAKNLLHLMNFQGGDGGATECIFELADKSDGSNNEYMIVITSKEKLLKSHIPTKHVVSCRVIANKKISGMVECACLFIRSSGVDGHNTPLILEREIFSFPPSSSDSCPCEGTRCLVGHSRRGRLRHC
jgi:hypothetical protein